MYIPYTPTRNCHPDIAKIIWRNHYRYWRIKRHNSFYYKYIRPLLKQYRLLRYYNYHVLSIHWI